MTNEGELPPHWISADDQIRADIRESQRRGREQQAAMWRRAGYSEEAVQKKLAEHDQRVAAMHEAAQSGVENRPPNVEVGSPATARSQPQQPTEPPRQARPAPEPDLDPEPERARRSAPSPRREPAHPDLPPVPGKASRWLTGYYRYGVGVLVGTAVAALVWVALQALGAAFLSMTMWSWLTMILAGFLPLIGLLWWISEVHREVQHYINFGGRVPVRFRRW